MQWIKSKGLKLLVFYTTVYFAAKPQASILLESEILASPVTDCDLGVVPLTSDIISSAVKKWTCSPTFCVGHLSIISSMPFLSHPATLGTFGSTLHLLPSRSYNTTEGREGVLLISVACYQFRLVFSVISVPFGFIGEVGRTGDQLE